MNYLELINKCLLELNYREVNAFSELVKNDHKRIMSIINIINREICNSDNWNFLLRSKTLNIPARTTMVENTINGRILHLLIDGTKYHFKGDFEKFLTSNPPAQTYSICSDQLLFPKFPENKTAEVIYYTQNCATSSDGSEKEEMTVSDDQSLLPMPFAEQLLVYGTCLRLKGNPSYIKFNYWMSMYKEALLNLKSKSSIDANDSAKVRLFRR